MTPAPKPTSLLPMPIWLRALITFAFVDTVFTVVVAILELRGRHDIIADWIDSLWR